MFRSFEAAWSELEGRSRPLDSLAELLPDDDRHVVRVWLIPLDPGLGPAVQAVQRRLSHLPWLRPLPAHLLHVTIGRVEGAGQTADREALAALRPFPIELGHINHLHGAVVAEIRSADGALQRAARAIAPWVEPETFLPHLTLAAIWQPGPPAELRDALTGLRETPIGTQTVSGLLLCDVPAGRGTFLSPWTVVERVELRGG